MKFINKLILTLTAFGLCVSLSASVAYAQAVTTQTALSAAVTSTAQTVSVSSATGIAVGGELYMDREAATVLVVNGTTLTLRRGVDGTAATAHVSGSIVWSTTTSGGVITHNPFQFADPIGSCTAAQQDVLPVVNVINGNLWQCVNSYWQGTNNTPGFDQIMLPRTPVSAADYTATLLDYIIAYTSLGAARTVTIPSPAGVPGHQIVVVDEAGAVTSTNSIQLKCSNGCNFFTAADNGVSASGALVSILTIQTKGGLVRIYSNGTNWIKW